MLLSVGVMISGMVVVVERLFDTSPFALKLFNLKRSPTFYLLLQFNRDLFLVRGNDTINVRPLLATVEDAWNKECLLQTFGVVRLLNDRWHPDAHIDNVFRRLCTDLQLADVSKMLQLFGNHVEKIHFW